MKKKTRWTEADLLLLQPGTAKVIGEMQTPIILYLPKEKKAHALPPQDPEGLAHMKLVLQALKIPYVTERIFHPTRKWRFDLSAGDESPIKWAAEYEGIFSEKSRHTTLNGYNEDCNKYSAATVLGWRVIRYTQLNFHSFADDICKILNLPTP